MEIPRIWRTRGERMKGPGATNGRGEHMVNGKVFNSDTGETESPIQIKLREAALPKTAQPLVVIEAVANISSE